MNWKVPKIWQDGEVWIIGGGPSLTKQFEIPDHIVTKVKEKQESLKVYSPYFSSIHNKHVIGINVAYQIGNWMDMVFFGDKRFLLEHRAGLAAFPNLIVSCANSTNHRQFNNAGVRLLSRYPGKKEGISDDPRRVCWNHNSGAAAISVAANAGAKRIVLVGFDMKSDGNSAKHWHAVYRSESNKKAPKMPYNRHLRGFPRIKRDADKRGIEIINACPDSAIEEFPKHSVKEVLNNV